MADPLLIKMSHMGNNIARRFWALTTLAIVSGLGCSDATQPTTQSQLEAPATALASLTSSTGVSSPITNRLPGAPCVDVADESHVAGTQVRIWSCHGSAGQTFSWMADGSIRAYASTTPMCLTSIGTGQDGDRIQIQACAGSAQQKWTATSAGEIRGLNGKCLDVYNANPASGTPLMLWNCYGNASQHWDNSASSGTVAPPPSPTVASVVVTLAASSLQVGQTTQASAVARDGSGATVSGASITWSSSNTAVATVSTSGLVTAVASGSASITATSSGKTGSQSLTVGSGSTTPVPPGASGASYGSATPAQLPQLSVNTAYPSMTRQVRVPAGSNLQTAINNALPGDELLLAPGATYTGQFTLPNKGSNTAWIVIRTDLPDATIGYAGTRMTPSRAASANLAKIVGNQVYGPMATSIGANHYRFTGVEFVSSVTGVNALVRFGDNTSAQNSAATTANNLILDRVYIHGTSSQDIKRCVMLNSATSAVVDSWLSDCHSNQGDSQAIVGWNGPGPFLIQNNHLEAGHEVVMFGGGDMTTQNASPADITIRGNHIMRPASWKGVWQAKNLFESKHSRRVLIEGNVFENEWADAQAGFAFVMKSENQTGGTPWTQTSDITIRYNRIRNIGQGFNLAGNPATTTAIPASRFVITDNVIENVGNSPYTGEGRTFQLLGGGLSDVVVMHNTVANSGGTSSAAVYFGGGGNSRLVMHSNILMHGMYGVKGDATGAGTASLQNFAAGYLFTNNAVTSGGTATSYPANNYFPAAPTNLGFISLSGGDYRLSTSSVYLNKGYDGRDIGADINTVNSKTNNVVVGP